jgi:hypothetical protein
MATEGICAGCGRPLSANALKGLRPKCLMRAGLAAEPQPLVNQRPPVALRSTLGPLTEKDVNLFDLSLDLWVEKWICQCTWRGL